MNVIKKKRERREKNRQTVYLTSLSWLSLFILLSWQTSNFFFLPVQKLRFDLAAIILLHVLNIKAQALTAAANHGSFR